MASFMQAVINFPSTIWSFHMLWQTEFYRHLSFLKDHETFKLTKKREVSFSGDIDVNEIR